MTQETKHTPAPWTQKTTCGQKWPISIHSSAFKRSSEKSIAHVHLQKGDSGQANANLIAAAPKMLDLIDTIADEYQKEGFSIKVWAAAARSVAAQARGES